MEEDDASFDETRRCQVSIQLVAAHFDVQEPKQLKVTWRRKNKSVTSKGHTVNDQDKVAKLKEKFGINAALTYNTRSGTWHPDAN